MVNEQGYVTLRINRSNGYLEEIIFTDSEGNEEEKVQKIKLDKGPDPAGLGLPVDFETLKLGGTVSVIDSITWWKTNPVCVRHDGYVY